MLPAILRDTSGRTSYLMSRLVFRRYTQFSRTICTSIPLRTSTRVSPGFAPIARRSSSFGSKPRGYSSIPKERPDRLAFSAIRTKEGKREEPKTQPVGCSRYASGPNGPFDSPRGITPRSVFQDGPHGKDPDFGRATAAQKTEEGALTVPEPPKVARFLSAACRSRPLGSRDHNPRSTRIEAKMFKSRGRPIRKPHEEVNERPYAPSIKPSSRAAQPSSRGKRSAPRDPLKVPRSEPNITAQLEISSRTLPL
eukprot:TRINITY_DN156_c0_g2_i1.p1 TRINITY_DN156_c0_g2~~TRINITY_DN156_c0_g2_i1.p1  ORF type:complete len:252 (+),score=-27.99 TRINITY_DN156_c0_g2_i1:2950-3705(+)